MTPSSSNTKQSITRTLQLAWAIIWRQILLGLPLAYLLGWGVSFFYSLLVEHFKFEIHVRLLAFITWITAYGIATLWAAYSVQKLLRISDKGDPPQRA